MANKFEEFSASANEYSIVKEIADDSIKSDMLLWDKKIKTSISLSKKNLEKLDDMVKQNGAKSRSAMLDYLIEKSYKDMI